MHHGEKTQSLSSLSYASDLNTVLRCIMTFPKQWPPFCLHWSCLSQVSEHLLIYLDVNVILSTFLYRELPLIWPSGLFWYKQTPTPIRWRGISPPLTPWYVITIHWSLDSKLFNFPHSLMGLALLLSDLLMKNSLASESLKNCVGHVSNSYSCSR